MKKSLGQIIIIVITAVLLYILNVNNQNPLPWYYYLLIILSFPANLLFERLIRDDLIPLYGTIFLCLFVSIVNLLFWRAATLAIPLSLFILLVNYHLTFTAFGSRDSPLISLTFFLTLIIILLIGAILQIPFIIQLLLILSILIIFSIALFHITFVVYFVKRATTHPGSPTPFSELRSGQAHYKRLLSDIAASTELLKTTGQEIINQAQSISTASQEMNASAQEISSTIQNISKGTGEQSHSITTIAQSIETLLRISDNIVSHSKMTSISAGKAAKSADDGMKLLKEASVIVTDLVSFTEQMREKLTGIRFLGDEVRKILDLIRSVADQTELLAINAAIEAARSGETGKGFSVVAEEIRTLATRSLEASKRVKDMIKEVDRTIEMLFETVDLEVDKVGKNQEITTESLNQYQVIAKTVKLTSNQIKQIVDSTGRQSDETKNIAQQVDIIAQVAEDTASATEEVAAAVEQLTASLEELSSRANDLASIAKELGSVD